jgi:glycerophosphoryl diester phosphodiesterase
MRRLLPRFLLGLLIAIAIVIGILFAIARPAPDHAFFTQSPPRPLVIAHQGGDGLWPGETLFAYRNAQVMGVDMLEGDVHITQDGVLILMHDESVDRTTDGEGLISDLTLKQIRALDAGYDWTPDGGASTPYRGKGIGVATLEEIFKAFPGSLMNLEIKKSAIPLIEPLCRLIRQYNMEDKVLIASFYADKMQEFRTFCPEIATSATQDEVIAFFVWQTLFLELGYSPSELATQVPETRDGLTVVTQHFVEAAHRRNMEVHVWTVNEQADMERMLALGVDGIITDYPDRLLELLGRK